VEAVLTTIERLGGILGAGERAAELAVSMRERLERVRRRVSGHPRVRVLFMVWGDPVLAPGRGAFINDALALAGADSISAGASARWTEYDLEQILAAGPEVILTVPDNREFAESLPGRPGWVPVPAVRDGRIHVVGDAIQQPGPRIVEGIEEIAALLHPD
jgi:iron complex transport system substrate-binding protein